MSDCERTEERLVERLDGTLTPHERAALEAHLEACAACRDLAADTERLLAAVHASPLDEPDAGPSAFVLAAAHRAAARPRRVRRAGLALAAAALVAVSGWLLAERFAGAAPPPEELLETGRALLERGEAAQAAKRFEAVLRADTEHRFTAEALDGWVRALLASSQYEAALSRADALLSLELEPRERVAAQELRDLAAREAMSDSLRESLQGLGYSSGD